MATSSSCGSSSNRALHQSGKPLSITLNNHSDLLSREENFLQDNHTQQDNSPTSQSSNDTHLVRIMATDQAEIADEHPLPSDYVKRAVEACEAVCFNVDNTVCMEEGSSYVNCIDS